MLDNERELHMQAWLNQQVKATKKVCKKTIPYFKNFQAFFDYTKHENEITGNSKKEKAEPDSFQTMLLKANRINKDG